MPSSSPAPAAAPVAEPERQASPLKQPWLRAPERAVYELLPIDLRESRPAHALGLACTLERLVHRYGEALVRIDIVGAGDRGDLVRVADRWVELVTTCTVAGIDPRAAMRAVSETQRENVQDVVKTVLGREATDAA